MNAALLFCFLHDINSTSHADLDQCLQWDNSDRFLYILYCASLFAEPNFLCIYVLRVASGPRVKLVSCKSALNPPVVCSTDRSKAVVPVLVLLLVALWFILRGDLLYVFPCVILFFFFFFSPFSIAITSLGEERANLSAFRTFVRFVLV